MNAATPALLDLSGHRAVVTGGSRGVGRATALLLARAGAHVGIGYRSRAADAAEVVSRVEALGGSAWAAAADLAAEDEARGFFRIAGERFQRLDVLVVNAGIWPAEEVALAEMEPGRWHETVAANLTSVYHTVRFAVPLMSEGGRIVLVSSTAGQRGEAFHADYAATKGALISLTKSLAVELAPAITVNCVAPGWIDTEMVALPFAEGGRERIEASIPLGRVASAEDVAGPIVFLCSGLARHVTGEILNVNGGSVLCG